QVGFPVIVEVSRVLVIVRTSDGERLRGECAIAVVDGDTNSIGTRTIAADYAQPSVAENVDSGKRQGAGGNRDGSWPGECSGAGSGEEREPGGAGHGDVQLAVSVEIGDGDDLRHGDRASVGGGRLERPVTVAEQYR